jgi:hypothetical protein
VRRFLVLFYSYAERLVRGIKESCLERMSLFGEEALRTAVREFVAHYHSGRNHQGIGNLLILPDITRWDFPTLSEFHPDYAAH